MCFHSSFINFESCKFTRWNKNPVSVSPHTILNFERAVEFVSPSSTFFKILSLIIFSNQKRNYLPFCGSQLVFPQKKRLGTREWTAPSSKKSMVGLEVHHLWLHFTLDWLIIILYLSLYKIFTQNPFYQIFTRVFQPWHNCQPKMHVQL